MKKDIPTTEETASHCVWCGAGPGTECEVTCPTRKPTLGQLAARRPALIITRGLPASGKSTYARQWVAEGPARRARVNRDDLRSMAHASVYLGDDTERQIEAARDAMITALLGRGVSVVSDDTNLPSPTAQGLRRLAVLAGATFDVVDLTDVPLEECLRRNASRDGVARVPEEWIREMHARHIAGQPYPLPLVEEERS